MRTDEDLIELVCRGNPHALAIIVARHRAPALALAYRICRRTWLAEDIVQDAFAAVWRSREQYQRARGSVRAWVLTAVYSHAIDATRRESAQKRLVLEATTDERSISTESQTEQSVLRRDDADRLRSGLEQLPTDQREVLELSYLAGLSHAQIAARLDLPPGTVKGRIRLGKQKLRLLLD